MRWYHIAVPMGAAAFALGGAVYAVRFTKDRRGVCVDCQRQKEIAEEIYFGKKPKSEIRIE